MDWVKFTWILSNAREITTFTHRQTVFYLLNLIRAPSADGEQGAVFQLASGGDNVWLPLTNLCQASPIEAIRLTGGGLYDHIHSTIIYVYTCGLVSKQGFLTWDRDFK